MIKYILDFLVFVAYHVDKKHRRIAKVNLDLAFGESKSEEEKARIIKSALRNIVYNLYAFIILQKESFEEMQKKVVVENDEVILKLLEEKKSMIIVSAHYGCWEFSLPYFAMCYNPLTIISRKLNNPYINTIFMQARERQGLSMCEKDGAAVCMIRALKRGNAVALTIDQSINPKQSVDVNFFGHKASQVDSPVRLASKLGAVIVPMFTLNEGFERHRLVFHEPIEVKPDLDASELQRVSQQLSDIVETQIRQRPDEWFWQHRRWKLYYSEIYKK